ncbi:FolC bifunctional protein [Thermobaculum terrenum ATCC BAA-798]|uniref:tetrahydrofolate synthase n=1 Tax=Thermobaculum terrenum (strain ATCC BAA-798 / CCMEE 7001 / YNP1) TaxID=525904 RepID=D1CGA1_THET1|nr:folylpolyglutamate synthase/dihydrofolate synthase family protein [Thermobaculum terrenum]ACZ41957.1 FolC bifunctional protein [Thermobaculum terrenum ATCC BAA-798]
MTINSYADALRYIYSFADYERNKPRSPEGMHLENVRLLLESVGNPHEKLKLVHIAGTKGKGSTSAMISSVLISSGYKVGTYTSPHLHTHRERYQINAQPVNEDTFVNVLNEIKPAADELAKDRKVTTYEITTALAFKLFEEEDIDWGVIEVGLGGRLDSTNVIIPKVSVITAISLDHTEVLGDTLAKIAAEKAGIIKPQVPVVIAPQYQEAMEVLKQRALDNHSQALIVDELMEARNTQTEDLSSQSFTLHTKLCLHNQPLDSQSFTIPLIGRYQTDNALTAITTAWLLSQDAAPAINLTTLMEGLRNVKWPGRFEVVPGTPLIILDGAHNPESVGKLKNTVKELLSNKRRIYVFGAGFGHDFHGMLEQLREEELIICKSIHPRAVPPETLSQIASNLGIKHQVRPTVEEALDLAKSLDDVDAVIVGGSLFVVADARLALGLTSYIDPVTS